jgi:putative flippase GtrA
MKAASGEIFRYAVNGLIATGIHYLILYCCIEVLNFSLVGLANLWASLIGVTFSFLGNRYFVFSAGKKKLRSQYIEFLIVYSLVAAIHGIFLYIWSDVLGKNYNQGFVLAVIIQITLGYVASKYYIFKNATEITGKQV